MTVETEAALWRLLVDLERPEVVEEWRDRGPRNQVVEGSDHSYPQSSAA